MPLVTREQLLKLAPKADAAIVSAIVDHADVILPRYGLATTLRCQHFLAQICVESAGLAHIVENLNYSAERAHEVWPTRFPTATSAAPYAHNQRALANRVYGDRMGNTGPDDGFLNRGQGLIQTTGHTNIARLAAYLGLPFATVRGMLTAPASMLECAAATFVLLGAVKGADVDDPVAVTHAINGGLNGLSDRKAALKKAKALWPKVTPPKPPTAAPVTPKAPAPAIQKVPMHKTTIRAALIATLLSLFSVSAAQAAGIDMTPLVNAGIDGIVAPVLHSLIPLVLAFLAPAAKRFLDEKSAASVMVRVDQLLDRAIAYAAQQAKLQLSNADLRVNVDSWIEQWALEYANDHAAGLVTKAGGVLSEKIQARLSSHPEVAVVKSLVANDNVGPAPLVLAGAAEG